MQLTETCMQLTRFFCCDMIVFFNWKNNLCRCQMCCIHWLFLFLHKLYTVFFLKLYSYNCSESHKKPVVNWSFLVATHSRMCQGDDVTCFNYFQLWRSQEKPIFSAPPRKHRNIPVFFSLDFRFSNIGFCNI
jgi:hypothetical protein